MWGEIETPAQTRPSQFCGVDASPVSLACEPTAVQPDALNGCASNIPEFIPTYCQQPQLDKTSNSRVDSSSVFAMVEAVALSDSPVKSQQIGEAELTLEQRREELMKQYRARPLVFFERYQAHLKPQHLVSFSHLISDPRAQHYCRVVLRRASSRTDRTRVRNQRYAALRALQKEGEYFSEEQMRVREPLLYEQYVGQYLSEEEVLERSQEAMQGGSGRGGEGASGGGAGGLANLLLDSYQERLLQHRMQEQQEKEEGAQEEEEEDEEEEEGGSRAAEWEPNPEEKALLREEFVSQMHQRFLDGKDKDFNYREVDENPDYDNLDIVSRDAEEKYFDDDDDDEEEEEDDTDEEEEEGADEERKKRDSEEEDMIP